MVIEASVEHIRPIPQPLSEYETRAVLGILQDEEIRMKIAGFRAVDSVLEVRVSEGNSPEATLESMKHERDVVFRQLTKLATKESTWFDTYLHPDVIWDMYLHLDDHVGYLERHYPSSMQTEVNGIG